MNTIRIIINLNCYQIYLIGVIASKNNRHYCKIDRFWNTWKCLQNGLHAWLAFGGWGRLSQQEGVVGNHGTVVILKYHRREEQHESHLARIPHMEKAAVVIIVILLLKGLNVLAMIATSSPSILYSEWKNIKKCML